MNTSGTLRIQRSKSHRIPSNNIFVNSYGWGVLVLAGGGSYYFAKKSINKDRAERAEADNKRRMQARELQNRYPMPPQKQDGHANASKEATEDVSPASGHAAESGSQGFESTAPYRSKKGDRFS
ncbi:hypothetical protein E4T45_03275 [Aureobasidium sp. EXF-8846]|nr:hypothetical protein E4T45_03275 [Aureobasidium sp. EXF-8846]